MKSTKGLYLSVPTPCEENWSEMTHTAAGKHCSSCNKTVIDFSLLTDIEIFAVINNSRGSVCGHFSDDQLGRCIPAPVPSRSSLLPAMLLTAGLAVSIANEGHAATRGLEQAEMGISFPVGDTGAVSVCKTRDLPEIVVTAYGGKRGYSTGHVIMTNNDIDTNRHSIAPVYISVNPVNFIKPVVPKKRKRWFFRR